MSRATLARRYGPLLAVAAVQLLIIAVVPSRAPGETQLGQQGALGNSGGTAGLDGVIDPETGLVIDPNTGQVIGSGGSTLTSGGGSRTSGGSGSGPGGGPGGGGPGGSGPGGGGPGGPGAPAGDTSHCVQGRQYDPTIYEWAPPCVPKFSGNNGGSTYNRGVTKDTIKVVVMKGNYGEAVNKVLEQQGTPSEAQMKTFVAGVQKFINSKYELHGRRISMEVYQIKAITGGQDKPDDAALREEMRQLVRDKNPFAVIWANSVSSATYEVLSELKVVNLGGYGFTDDFNVTHRPYHWDVQMGGYQLAEQVSTWYCARMHGGGTAIAQYAGRPSSGFTDLHTRPRTVGIITTKDPQNLATADRVTALLKSKCGVEVKRRYEYEQNIQTLQEQRQQAYENMTGTAAPGPTATTVMCFCDQVAPAFLYFTCWQNNYFPEHLIVATGVMDLDRVAQAYDHGAEDRAFRQASEDDGKYPQFENAFGLAQFPKMKPANDSPAARVWKAAGETTAVPHEAVDEDWNYYAMLAGMIQMAGPTLDPFRLETGAHKMGTLGGTASEFSGQRSLGPGDYTWNDTLREVYWAPETRSAFNNIKGSYTSLNGGRWFRGQFPSGLLALPPKPRP